MNIGTLTGRIELDDSFSSGLNTAIQKLETAGAKAAKMGTSLTRAGTALSLGITAPLVAAAGASLAFSSKFEAQMTRLVTIAGVSQDELAGVKQHILDLAPAVGIGPTALADAMTKVSSTVSDTATALKILDISAQGAKAGFGETVDVAGALTSVINSYGKENITAARAADILAMAVKEGGAEAKELAPTLANVVPFAAQLGVAFEEVAANIATMTKLGVPTSEAVNSLTSVFSALTKETKQGTDTLESMGMSYADLRKQIREEGLAATLTDLSERFKGNETALVDVFGRLEAVKNVMGTAGAQAETYADVLDKVKRSSDTANGAMRDMADGMSGTQVQTWKELSATVETLAIKLGDSLAPAMGRVLDMARPLLDWVVRAVDGFTKLPQPIQMTAFAVVALVAAIGPLLFTVGTLITSLTTIGGAFTAMGVTAAGLASGPFVLLTAAFAGIAVVVKKYFDLLEDLKQAQGPNKRIDELAQKARDLEKALTPKIDAGAWEVVLPPLQQIGGAANKAQTNVKALTDEQKESAKEIKKALDGIRTATIPLTAAQEAQVLAWNKANIAAGMMATVLGISEVAVKNFLDATEKLDESLERIAVGQFNLGKAAVVASQNVAGFTIRTTEAVAVNRDFSIAAMQSQIQVDSFGHVIERNLVPSLKGMGGAAAQAELRLETLGQTGAQIKDNLKSAFAEIPDIIKNAFTGGGGIMGAMKAIGVQMADALVKPLLARLSDAMGKIGSMIVNAISGGGGRGGWAGVASSLIGMGTKSAAASTIPTIASTAIGTGAVTGGIGGSVLGGTGGTAGLATMSLSTGLATAGIGAAAVGVYVGIKKLMAQRREMAVNRDRDRFFKMEGNDLETLNDKVMKATGSLKLVQNLFSAKKEADYNAAVAAINETLAIYSEKLLAARDAQTELAARMEHVTDISPELQAALQTAYDSTSLDGYLTALGGINAVIDEQNAKQSFLNETMSKYGLTWVDLGEKARAAHVATEAANIEKEFRALLEAGVDVNNIMRHMGDNISDFVLEAVRSGTEVPESFRDVIQTAIDAGELFSVSSEELGKMRTEAEKLGKPFDDSKYKIEDISEAGITFGITMETATQNIATAMERLIAVIEQRLGPAITNIPDPTITARVRYNYDDFDPKRGYDDAEGRAGGGVIPGRPRGTDVVPIWATPGERVLTVSQNAQYERGMGGSGTVVVQIDGREVARATVPHLPDEIERQMGRVH